jgi:hypothetical protein
VTYHRVFSDPKLAAPIPFDQESLGLGRLGSWRLASLTPLAEAYGDIDEALAEVLEEFAVLA